MTLAHWPDTVDDIIGGDQAVILATVTPARGVVLTPATNFGARDRDGGTVTVNSSVGGWKKLQRIKREPKVALAFHARDHGYSDRPEYVLVQGTASLSAPLGDYPETLGADSGADGFPMVIPVSVIGDDQDGILLDPPPGILPDGGRRAGLTAHSFTKYVQGQHQRVHTGWLENGPEVRYAPHTELAYRTPPSRLVYRLGVGAAMRVAHRRARRAGHDILR
ncbi:pyridoxamine 5'-phosphate oxidase family protein [Actinomadura sp. NPDC000929]|uniref:pyridoxamine 5'-phosphate oxidase family protein n=1 Tax=Actinomadura sp. NPDC000929 TaxID=3154517 RepID=UPI0033939902